ncbi:MAG: hypothetical protein JOY77_02310 [Alphaproteobacteria bacterium]|nr:hypothetical protein [Alphaproteobacteria bacterium]
MQTRTAASARSGFEFFRITSLLTTLAMALVFGLAAGCGLAFLLWDLL